MSNNPLLLESFYALVDARPDKIQFTQPTGGGQVIDYTRAQVLDEASRMASWLKAQGFEPGSRIALASKNCAHFIIAELAIWMAGFSTVGIYPTANAETTGYVLEHSGAKLMFVGKLDEWTELRQGTPKELPLVSLPLAPKEVGAQQWNDLIAASEPLPERTVRGAEEMALIIYTSGSTGRPKGVMHGFGQISAASHGIVKELHINGDDRALSYLPLAHVFERAYVECVHFVAGGHIYFAESLTTFVQDLQRARPTVFISVPRLWLKFQLGVFKNMPPKKLNLFLKIPILNNIVRKKILTKLGLNHVRLAGSGSAPIPAELIAWYHSLGLNLLEGYAMSEDFAYSHLSNIDKNEPGYVGVPYPGVDVKISDAGEILIKSPGVMMGYYNEPEMTAECFTEDGFFKTGDRGERKPDGLLKITGRVKEIFKTSKGKYVSPAPIENIVNNDPMIELSLVSGMGMPQPYALCVLGEDLRPKQGDAAFQAEITPKLEAMLAEVNTKLEHHERLEFLAIASDAWEVSNGFLTPTLKIRRATIEEAYEARIEGWYEAKSKVIWA